MCYEVVDGNLSCAYQFHGLGYIGRAAVVGRQYRDLFRPEIVDGDNNVFIRPGDSEQDDNAAFVDALPRLTDCLPGGRRQDDNVGLAAVLRDEAVVHTVTAVYGLRSQPGGDLEFYRVYVDRENTASFGNGQFHMEEPRHPAPEDQDGLVSPRPGKALCPDGACKGLDKGALLVRDVPGKQVCSLFDENGRDQDILGEPPGKALADPGALRIVAVAAIAAFAARYLRRDKDPVAGLKPLHAFP